MHKYPYKWTLANARFTMDAGKVFSCFSGGGGSTMGWKLAGFDVVGCCEIDPRMMRAYEANHRPRLPYLCPVGDMLSMDLPRELYGLDVLDGSPPCSSFSIAGSREASWGKKKRFREGQAEQVLDELFFDFIALAKRLRPKAVVAENVKGLLMGAAKAYVARIMEAFEDAGYCARFDLLNSATMGVPQMRERVFFTALRRDLAERAGLLDDDGLFAERPRLGLRFDEPGIPFSEVRTPGCDRPLPPAIREAWKKRKPGDIDLSDSAGTPSKFFSYKILYGDRVANTVTGYDYCVLFDEPRFRNKAEVMACSSWPEDYDFQGQQPHYVCGMAVPPAMMARVAEAVRDQWLAKIP